MNQDCDNGKKQENKIVLYYSIFIIIFCAV